MYSLRDPDWVAPTLVPREGGFDTERDGVRTVQWPEPASFVVDDPYKPPRPKGLTAREIYKHKRVESRRSGANAKYGLRGLSVGGSIIITPVDGKPGDKSLRNYVSAFGVKNDLRYSVSRKSDGTYHVKRLE